MSELPRELTDPDFKPSIPEIQRIVTPNARPKYLDECGQFDDDEWTADQQAATERALDKKITVAREGREPGQDILDAADRMAGPVGPFGKLVYDEECEFEFRPINCRSSLVPVHSSKHHAPSVSSPVSPGMPTSGSSTPPQSTQETTVVVSNVEIHYNSLTMWTVRNPDPVNRIPTDADIKVDGNCIMCGYDCHFRIKALDTVSLDMSDYIQYHIRQQRLTCWCGRVITLWLVTGLPY